MKTKLDLKLDEIHFIDQIIRNMRHIEHLHRSSKEMDQNQLPIIKDALQLWLDRQWIVTEEINDLKGYPHYVQS